MLRPPRLVADDWLSAREAREFIFYCIRWGDHPEHDLRGLPDGEVEAALARSGFDLVSEISRIQRNPHSPVTRFENLLVPGAIEIVVEEGHRFTHSQVVDGLEFNQREAQGHAVLRQAHKADFEEACRARDEAIRSASFDSFYTSLQKAISSVEGYLNLRAAVHNERCTNPDLRLEERRKGGGFVTLDTKIIEWLPAMTGRRVDPSTSPGWDNFQRLKSLRNDVVIHPKPNAGLSTLEELADGINRFRSGIGSLMFLLHQAFSEPMQSSIIRAMRYPTVRIAKPR